MARIALVRNPRRLNVYLPGALIDATKAHAFSRQISISAVISESLHAHIPPKVLSRFGAKKAPLIYAVVPTSARARRKVGGHAQ